MNFKPKDELITEWLAALRSGKYKQSRGVLKDTDGYCCLGVLAEIAGLPQTLEGDHYFFGEGGDGSSSVLPCSLARHMGMSEGGGFKGEIVTLDDDGYDHYSETLAELNDEAEYDFEQIANVIEEKRDEIFSYSGTYSHRDS